MITCSADIWDDFKNHPHAYVDYDPSYCFNVPKRPGIGVICEDGALIFYYPPAAKFDADDLNEPDPLVAPAPPAALDPPRRAGVLEQAKACVCGQRERDYGSPDDLMMGSRHITSAPTAGRI